MAFPGDGRFKQRQHLGPHRQAMVERIPNGRVTWRFGAATTSVAVVKSDNQAVQNGASVRPVHVESVSQKYADAEKHRQRRHDLHHSFAPR
jgi:hypothetical protein